MCSTQPVTFLEDYRQITVVLSVGIAAPEVKASLHAHCTSLTFPLPAHRVLCGSVGVQYH